MPESQTMDTLTAKMDELGGAFAEYRKCQDERVKQIEENGQVGEELLEKMGKLEATLSDLDQVKGEMVAAKARMDQLEAAAKRPGKQGADEDDPGRPFKSLGEHMQAVAKSSVEGATRDERLDAIKAVSGLNETVPSEGGFLVQTDFSSDLLKRTYEIGAISSRVRRIPISAKSNGLKIPMIDEDSRVDGSRYGGIQALWVEEGGEKTLTKPSFGEMELKLHKLVARVVATDELLEDATALEALIMMIFPEEMNYQIENAFVRGNGAGKPLGILNAAATVTVNKEAGQPATTLVWENIVAMWARLWARSQQNSVWLINQDTLPQLMTMTQQVGTGGVPVYLPADGAAGRPHATLMGRPVIAVEYCSTMGTVGDIILVDWSSYLTIDKGGIQSASSMHVRFIYDEMTFRFVYRVDGQPMWQSALTPANGTNTLSPVVMLESRT